MNPQDQCPLKKSLQDLPFGKTLEKKNSSREEMGKEFLFFSLGSHTFGISTDEIVEILPLSKVHPIPGVPPHILGVIHWHLEIIPLLDIKGFFHITQKGRDERPRILVVEKEEMVAGLRVDRLHHIGEIQEEEIQPLSPGLEEQILYQCSQGLVPVEEKICTLLEVEKIFNHTRK